VFYNEYRDNSDATRQLSRDGIGDVEKLYHYLTGRLRPQQSLDQRTRCYW